MFTTVSIEFVGDTEQHLKGLEHALKHIHNVEVDLLMPRDHTAPVVVAIGVHEDKKRGAAEITQNIAQTLYTFLHEGATGADDKKIYLVTAEGDRVDIEPLPATEISRIITTAYEEQ